MTDNQANSRVRADNSETRTDGGPTAKITPSRKAYDSVASDVSISSALGELLDNSLDSAALQGINPVQVAIEHRTTENGTEEFVFRDEAGGVKQDDMGVFLGLGRSREDRADEQNVGTFGIGAKKALKRLGDRLTIGSRHVHADQGWQYTVEPEWFEITDKDDDPDQWEFPLESVDLEAGVTELRIQDLSFDWEHHKEEVVEWIRTTYRKFLDPESDLLTLELTIRDENGTVTVDGEDEVQTVEEEAGPLSAPPAIEWSYSPWLGGLHPRQFRGLQFDDPDWAAPIQARVTVGLLTEGSNTQSGTFIYCQNRLIESNLTDEAGGYGITRDGLNNYNPSQHKRLRIEIELFGDASNLPWNSDKSRIRATHKALSYTERGVYWWLRRVADRHMAAGKYGAFSHSSAVFGPFDADSEHMSRSEPEIIDISSKHDDLKQGNKDHIRIHQKPEKGFGEIDDLVDTARAHARLGIVAESMEDLNHEDWARPTYEIMLGAEFREEYYDAGEQAFDPIGAKLLTTTTDEVLAAIEDPQDEEEETDWAVVADYLTSVDMLPDVDSWTLRSGNVDDIDREDNSLQEAASDDISTGEDGERRRWDNPWRQPLYEAYLADYLEARDTELSIQDLPTYEHSTSSAESEKDEIDSEPVTVPTASGDDAAASTDAGPLDCPECGAELDGNVCEDCGWEYDVADDSESGTVSVKDLDPETAVSELRGAGDTADRTGEEQLTLAEFCQAHADLFGTGLPENLSEGGVAEDFLVEYLREQERKLTIAEKYVDLDELVGLQDASAD